MLQFARRRRSFWLLMLLFTVVAVQQLMRADGADERREHGSVSVEDEYSDLDEGGQFNDVEAEDQSKTDASLHSVATRTKKRAWPHYGKSSAVLLPLFLVGLAAAFAAAGFVVTHHKWKGGSAKPVEAPVAPEETDTSPSQEPSTREAETPPDLSPEGLQALISIGKRALPPAVALGVVTLVVTLIAKKYGVQEQDKSG